MRSFADFLAATPIPDQHPHRAVILVDGAPRSHGSVADRLSTRGGVFWPDNGEILAEPIQDGIPAHRRDELNRLASPCRTKTGGIET